jgi:hypothetical protein
MDVVCTGQARLEGSINVSSVAGRQGAQSSVSPDMALQEILTSNQDFSRANFVCARLLYTPRPKIFASLDFYILNLNIRLIQKICENLKTLMIYLKYI